MTAPTLRQLQIACLRGSTGQLTLPFEKGKKLTIVFGENASGKSTICDALELLGKGKVGSIEGRGLGKTRSYWHSIGRRATDVKVTLQDDGGTCIAVIGKTDVVVIPEDRRPVVEVLRRAQILRLIEAKAAERYDAIRRFIDLAGIEASEETLREAIREGKKRRDDAVIRVNENESEIRRLWEQAGSPGDHPLAWARDEAAKDTLTLGAEMGALGQLAAAYDRLSTAVERSGHAREVLTRAQQTADVSRRTLESVLAGLPSDARDTLDILQAAAPYFASHPHPAVCPLCDSAENAGRLAEHIAGKLQQLQSVLTAQTNRQEQETAVRSAEQTIRDVEAQIRNHAIAFQEACRQTALPQGITLPRSGLPSDGVGMLAWLGACTPMRIGWQERQAVCQAGRQLRVALKGALGTYDTNIEQQVELGALLPRLERVLEIVEEERHRWTDGRLAAIAGEVGRLYEEVHPGEGLNKLSLALDPKKRASLDMGADFLGVADTPPQAYFSDSHLDTLGLCAFLALASLERPEETILVLDDVLGSVDEPHVDRLIEMLYREVVRFRHCLMTTHYGPWKQKLRWGWLKNGQCQFVELAKWTPQSGVTLTKSLPQVDTLRQLLAANPPDPQLVCAKAGVVLEAALDFLTQLYECPVPRRQGQLYTLGDLLPAIDKKLRQALKVEVLEGRDAAGGILYRVKQLGPHLDELARIAQMRNVFGCHFNQLSFDLLETDAISFGREVLGLMEVLTDEETGWPRSDASGSYWATSGETRRLHPLKRPS